MLAYLDNPFFLHFVYFPSDAVHTTLVASLGQAELLKAYII